MDIIPEHDKNLDSSPLLSDKSNPKIEYLAQKYPDFPKNEDKPSKVFKPISKNTRRMRSDGSKLHKSEKNKSLGARNKENIKPLSKSKVTIKTTKEAKRTEETKETKRTEPQEKKRELKEYLADLENKIEKQQKKIKNIKTSLEERKNHFQEYAKQLKETKKFEKLIENYEVEKQRFEKNEMNLIKNLSDQQKLTKEALNKLYNYQEDGLNEKDQIRQYYELQMKDQLAKMEKKYKGKIKSLKKRNEELFLLQKAQGNKHEGLINNYEIDLTSLKNQLNLQIKENEGLIKENVALKSEIKDRREKVEMDLNHLKSKMMSENEIFIKENEEKISLKQKIQALNKELEIKDKQTRENEDFYKQQIDKLEDKISVLQQKFYQSNENRAKIEELNDLLQQKENEIHQYKNLSQEKTLMQKTMNQANQKQQWSKIYTELIDEIKGLKNEIDQLGSENKRLLSSVSNNRFASESQIGLSSKRL